MYSMFIKQRVQDYASWKPVFDQHESTRREYGFTGHSVHRDADDPNVVIVALRATDLKLMRDFGNSDTLREAMERAGVQGKPEIWLGEDLEDRRYS